MKLTPWYPGHIKPVRKGVYERQYNDTRGYCKWDGKKWRCGWPNIDQASQETIKSLTQGIPWRGIAKD